MQFRRKPLLESANINMTPMIDVVFQLIIFLMLASEITNTDLERLIPPQANAATSDTPAPENRTIINVAHNLPFGQYCPQLDYNRKGELTQPCLAQDHWKLMYKGKELTPDKMDELLSVLALPYKKDPGDPSCPSNLLVMIRADSSAPYRFTNRILESCGKAKVWQVEIAAQIPPRN